MAEPVSKKISSGGLKNTLRLFEYIKPYSLEYAGGMFFLLGSSLSSLAFPKLLGELVSSGNQGSLSTDINRIALMLLFVLLIQATFSYFRVILFVNVTEKSLALLRQNAYNHLIKLPLQFFEKHRVGELNSRISSDISLLQETLTTTLAEFIRQIIIITGGITLLAITSWKLTIFMLVIVPPMMILAVLFGRFIRKLSKKVQKEVASSNTIVEETLSGIQSVKTYTNEFLEMKRYKEKTSEIAAIGMKSGKYRASFSAFMIFGLFGAMVAVIWRGSILMSAGTIDAGELFSFVIYSGFVGGTFGGLAGVFTQLQRFIGATEELFELFEEKEENLSTIENITENDIINGTITLQNVSFRYPARPAALVLDSINAVIGKDKMIALVGPSGAGKSTLAALIMRLYEPTSGEILFDNKSSKALPLSSLRRQIAVVPQDIFLFGGTIRENIMYGKPSATGEEIREAARKANALEFIEKFSDQFETIVGERGIQLSGGQRQRIAIARAVLKDPRILILDEATSSLDSESERLIKEALENLMKGRTSVVIAHRLSTIRKADQIFVINGGKIVEAGTHEELVSIEKGFYRNLSELQFSL
ncbi:MAG TPA: ABC transporter transmembrane domain-containing protein [Bacteroidales bacterium]|nr:ABC transporter transmembrane domain-containing protein [Bacteroidales bacterium]